MIPNKANTFRLNWSVKFLILLILAFFLAAPFFQKQEAAFAILITLGCLATLALVLRFKVMLLYLLAFIIPFSFPVEMPGGSSLIFPSEFIALFLSAFLIIKFVLGERPSRDFLHHPITLLLALDLIWMFVTTTNSGLPIVSLKRWIIRLIYDLSFYYFMFELFKQDQKSIPRIIFFHLLGMIIPIFYTLYQHAQIKFAMIGSQTICAPFYYDHTIYGAALVFYVPFLIQSLLVNKRNLSSRLSILFLVILLPAIFFSFSRAAWLSLIIALITFYLVYKKVSRKVILAIGFLALIAATLNMGRVNNLFQNNKEESHTNDIGSHIKSVSNISTDASNKERINRWKCALRMFADKPLLGFGPGTYQFFYGPYQHRNELTRISTFTGNKGHSHSEYLNYLSESGLAGLLIFCGLIIVSVNTARRIILRNKEDAWLALALICCLITFYFHAFFNGFLEFDKMAMPVFSSLAALTVLDLQQKWKSHVDHS